MDTSGNLYRDEDEFFQQDKPLIPLNRREYEELLPLGAKHRKGYMRNKPCICGSGKKFKRCCWSKYA